MRETQYVSVESAQVYETTRITITDPDDGNYILIFQDPSDLSFHQGDAVAADASASTLKNAIKEFYSDTLNSNIDVNLTMYDVNGTETDNSTEAITYEYYVTLTRLINDMSVSDIRVIKTTSKSTIEVDLPADVQLSAVPLSGYYRIKCIDHEGYESYSEDLNLGWGQNWVNE
jgi:hypothetical protein